MRVDRSARDIQIDLLVGRRRDGGEPASSAFSPNIKERRDYSCAVFNREGSDSQGDHMPVHLGSMPMSVRAALETVRPPGRHSGPSTTHTQAARICPDVTLVAAVVREPGAGCGGRGKDEGGRMKDEGRRKNQKKSVDALFLILHPSSLIFILPNPLVLCANGRTSRT